MHMHASKTGEYPVQVVLEVANRDELTRLFRALDTATVEATTESIVPATLSAGTTVSFDIGILTDKQRQTLELALEEGYYERPREVSLSELADRLDISKSAVSQRIRTAEIKLVKNAFQRYR